MTITQTDCVFDNRELRVCISNQKCVNECTTFINVSVANCIKLMSAMQHADKLDNVDYDPLRYPNLGQL